MSETGRVLKRLVVGRAMRSDRLEETLLPKRIALPVFASDALSSVAYAPDEILLTLAMAGGAFALVHSWQIAVAVALVMLVVVASYRQNVHAYPSGGGDYEVATENLGRFAGLGVGSALLVDYVLTVAVSVSSGVQNAGNSLTFVRGHEALVAAGLIGLLTLMNLRGVRESGSAFALPTYAFMITVLGMAAWGFVQLLTGHLGRAESADWTVLPEEHAAGLGGVAMAFLLLRAFSSGCAALTGVEAVSNGVPAFRRPKSRNAATTLALMATISISMLLSIVVLARETGVQFAESTEQLRIDGRPVAEGFVQDTVLGQIGKVVFADAPWAVLLLSVVTGLILVLAANTAFNGFPVLASILARDEWLPRQLHQRGDRLVYSNGILMLAGAAVALVLIYDAQVTRLIQLYIVGVFVSFTLSQIGMVRHWNRALRKEKEPRQARSMRTSRIINLVGATMAAVVLLVVLLTKFMHGAGLAIAAMGLLFLLMTAIHRHYEKVADELSVPTTEASPVLPSRVHALVLVAGLHKPTMRALAYARASHPYELEAITVAVEPETTRELRQEWERRGVPVTLRALDSPYREITQPVVEYVRRIRRDNPRELVVVYIPEYVLGRWYENLLHNQSANRLKRRLLFMRNVVVTSVPWQLESSHGMDRRYEPEGLDEVRWDDRRG